MLHSLKDDINEQLRKACSYEKVFNFEIYVFKVASVHMFDKISFKQLNVVLSTEETSFPFLLFAYQG